MPTTTPNYGLSKPLVNDPTDQDLWGGFINGDMDIIDTTLKTNANAAANALAVATSAGIPLGGMIPYTGPAAPTNYVFPYGQAINRTTYATYFALVGTAYGTGDGSTTFNVPDIRGRVVAGQDNMGGAAASRLTSITMTPDGNTAGASGGEQTHTLTINEIPAHTHTLPPTATSVSGGVSLPGSGNQGSNVTGSTGGGAAHNNTQPTIVLPYILRVL